MFRKRKKIDFNIYCPNPNGIYFIYIVQKGKIIGYRIENGDDFIYKISACSKDRKINIDYQLKSFHDLKIAHDYLELGSFKKAIYSLEEYISLRQTIDKLFDERKKSLK